MASYSVNGHSELDLQIEDGAFVLSAGSKFMLDPAWDVSTDVLHFTFADDDSALSGDDTSDEIGNDASQSLVVTDAAGNMLYSGQAYIESAAVFTAPDGTTITMYRVEIGGQVVGEIASHPLQPGVTYQVSAINDVTSGPDYSALGSTYYDPDAANYIQGGEFNDFLAGGSGNDGIVGGGGRDTIYGGDGNDQLRGDAGADTIHGDAGSDTLFGGSGNDSLLGGADRDLFVLYDDFGADTIDGGSTAGTTEDDDSIDFAALGSGITVTFTGAEAGTATNGANTVTFTDIESIEGTNYADNIDAAADTSGVYLGGDLGDDTITGGSGDDTLEGGAGADQIWGGGGSDGLWGGSGNDTLYGGAGLDFLTGGGGADRLYGGDDTDMFSLYTTDGSETIFGGEGGADWDTVGLMGTAAQVIWTGAESGEISYDGGTTVTYFWEIEEIIGSAYGDAFDAEDATEGVSLDSGHGDDTISGSGFADNIRGGAGDDILNSWVGRDTLDGGDGNDTIIAGGDSDLVYGGTGADSLDGGSGNDTIHGGDDADTIIAGPGANLLYGDAGNDLIIGSTTNGADTIYGGAGDDTIQAGIGPNLIVGGEGTDRITTGGGSDTIALTELGGNDYIVDFDMTQVDGRTVDQLDVSDLSNAEGKPVRPGDVIVSEDGTGNAVLIFPGGESVTLLGVSPTLVSGTANLRSIGIPCFVAGTRIATPRGPIPVERLCIGDLVDTRDGPPLPVLWAGMRRIGAAALDADPRLCPVEFRKGALGNDAVLRLSAQHGILVPAAPASGDAADGLPAVEASAPGPVGALARAGHMADSGWGGARRMRGARAARYHHLLLPVHALIAAEGVWVESFWPGPEALRALDPAQRFALIRALPALSRVLWRQEDPAQVYGPRVAPLLPRRRIERSACAKWSRLLQQAPFSDGFATESAAR